MIVMIVTLILQAHVVDGTLTTSGVLSGSLSCSWVYCVPDADPLSFQTGSFMVWTHSYICTYSYMQVHTSILVCTGAYWILLVFTFLFLCWGSGVCAGHHSCGPALSLQQHCHRLWTMFPLQAVGMHSPSYSSSATWVLRADGPLRTYHMPGWSDGGLDCNEEDKGINGPSQAFCRDLKEQEGWWSVINGSVLFCGSLYLYIPVHTCLYQYVLGIN